MRALVSLRSTAPDSKIARNDSAMPRFAATNSAYLSIHRRSASAGGCSFNSCAADADTSASSAR
jgi:hypothetical protein